MVPNQETVKQAAEVVAVAAKEAINVVATASAEALKASNLVISNITKDHDLLIELKTRMEGLKDDIKSLNDGISLKITEQEKKIENIFSSLDELPCEGRGQEILDIHKDIGWLQKIAYSVAGFIFVIVVPALISLAVAWGTLNNEVKHYSRNMNTEMSIGPETGK